MRKLLVWLVVGLALLWGGYWVIGAHLIERQLHGWVEEEKAAGNRADFSVLRVQGFPSRFDIHAEQIELYNPASGWGWRAPVAELAALSYQPQHYIAVLPHRQQLASPLGALDIESSDLRASAVFVPGPSFVLNRTSLVAGDLVLRSAAGFAEGAGTEGEAFLSIDALRFATRRVAGDPLSHRLGLELTGLELPPALLARLAPPEGVTGGPRVQALSGLLAESSGKLHLDAVASFERRLDRPALAAGETRPTRLRIDDLSAAWGPMAVALSGELAIDAEGLPQGTLAAKLTGVTEMLDLAAGVGMIGATTRRLIERGLRVAAAAGGGTGPAGELHTTLAFRDGMMMLGALPLGPAPRLHLP